MASPQMGRKQIAGKVEGRREGFSLFSEHNEEPLVIFYQRVIWLNLSFEKITPNAK